jgi:hypothetical protein
MFLHIDNPFFSFHVIGGGKFRRHFIETMCQFAYVVPNRLKGIS